MGVINNSQVKVNSILTSGRKDETLTYAKYIKDEESGKSVQQQLDEKVNVFDELETKQLKDKSVTNPKLDDCSVDSRVIKEKNVETKHLADEAVTTKKIAVESVTTERLSSKSVTTEKIADSAIETLQVKDGNITNPKLADESVSTEKIQDGSITNLKLADNTMSIDKLDKELREVLLAATGLPEGLIKTIQDVDKSLDKLNDTVYPITLGFSLSPNVGTMETKVSYSVSNEGKPYAPDALSVTKKVNDTEAKVIANTPVSSGSVTTPIEGNRETFVYTVGKSGRTGKSTSQTRYLCYYGSSATDAISEALLNTLGKVSTTGVSFNPSITTKNGEYIWLVVPNYLGINRVTSAGFDVTLATVQNIKTSLGTFKAYRTANSLTANKWNLVIS